MANKDSDIIKSTDEMLKEIEALKKKVAENTNANVNTKVGKEANHEILMVVANQLTNLIPQMLEFKSSFESFAVEMTALKNEVKDLKDKNEELKKENTQIKKENESLKNRILD